MRPDAMVATEDVLAGLKRALDDQLVGRPDAPDVSVLTCEPDDPYEGNYPYLVLSLQTLNLTRELTGPGRGNAEGRWDGYAFNYYQMPGTLIGATKAAVQAQLHRDMDDVFRAFDQALDDPLTNAGPSNLWGLVMWAGEELSAAHRTDYVVEAGSLARTVSGLIFVRKQFGG